MVRPNSDSAATDAESDLDSDLGGMDGWKGGG